MKFLRGRQQRRLLAEELQSHIDELAAELVSSGYTAEEARNEARRRFGNQTALLERSREIWTNRWLDVLLRDLRSAWRLWRRQPWTVAAAVASIAIGVGANTAVTSVVDAVMLNPLGLQHSESLVAATVHIKKLQMTGAETSGAELKDLQSASDVFSSVAATEGRAWTLGGDQPARLLGVAATSDYFQVFGVRPEFGAPFSGLKENAVILSNGLWKTRFAGSRSVIGQKLLLDSRPYTVVGVMPPDFHFPARAEAWIPLVLTPDRFQRGMNMSLSLYARLRGGVSVLKAQQRVDHELLQAKVSMNELGYGIDVEPLARRVAGDLRLPLLFLWAAAFVLLVAACANVAGLLMARASSRRKEMAIRISVGASKLQILRQLLTESTVLALFGGAAGVAVAFCLVGVLKGQPLPYQNLLALVRLDHRLLLYAFGLSLASSLLFGIAPAIELLREQHVEAMVRARRKWFQYFYIVGQVSAAMLLLIVMGLLLKSLQAVESLRSGFDAHGLTTAFLIKPPGDLTAFYERLLAGLRTTPGVQSAALAYTIPFAVIDAPTSMFDIKSRHHQPGEPEWHGEAYQVSPDYFKTLRIPLLHGRLIRDSDTEKARRVCVIDEGLARRFFENEEPIGQEIAMYGGWARVVGVVASVRDQTLERESRPVVYYPLAQIPFFPQVGLVVRSSIPAAALIRAAISKANPQVPVFDILTMQERIDASQATRSVMALLVSVFAGVSIVLAAVGIYGVVAQIVAERTAEIGVRMVMGARSSDIFKRYVLQGLQFSLLGIVIGLSAAAGCAGLLRSLLYRVQPLDPVVIVLGVLGVLLVSGLAVFAPAWRAAHVDPQIALRAE